ncbi:MAG: cyclopropane-fatty-acyl-phospholipid synthase [Humisphaera sp.]|nr:cyclopropane-fatty-acyl-phospholipid synthase [Humisphaera sp.]
MSLTASDRHEVPSTHSVRTSGGWAQRKVADLLAEADVRINGSRPCDMIVHDERLFRRLIVDGTMGLGDAYVDGWWDCGAIDQFFGRVLTADVPRRVAVDRHSMFETITQRVMNFQSVARARRNGERHYDLGNDLFAAMLDPRMTYTCGYWRNATTLNEAQDAKLDLVCRKVDLRRGQRVLDAGCGWGAFSQFAAERYGASVIGVTVSGEQVKLARERCAGLPVEIRLQDYREVRESFDHIVSIGMLEHVGPKNYRTCMRAMHDRLNDYGLVLLHFFAARRSFPNATDIEATWMTRRIFPGLVVPSMKQIGAAIDGLFVMEDLHNFGADYDPTLMAWFANFDAAWPSLREKYGERFYRMWKYYLLSCAGAFRCRKYQLWQIVLSKRGVRGGYESVR